MLFRDTNPCRQKRKLGKVGRKRALERLEFRQLLVGFAGPGINGDTSVGFEFFVGSGGGGGNAETNLARFFGYGGGNGGLSGGAGFQATSESAGGGGGGVSAGGGVIQQQATQEIIALTSSQIIADGAGFANLQGGFGAGGVVGLFAPSITVEQHATIRTLGGFDDGIGSTINGGTIKILYSDQFAGTLPQGNSGRSHVSAGMQVPVIDAQRTVSGDLRVTWTVGTAATEVMVFTKATGWDSFVTKQTAWGNSKELTFYGLRDATYHVAARSWSRLADDSWKPSGLSGRVPYLVAGDSLRPKLFPQGSVSGDLRVSWAGGTATTELIVFSQPTGWDSVVTKEKVYGGKRDHIFYDFPTGTYFVGARAWYQQPDGAWKASLLSPRVQFTVQGDSIRPTVNPQQSIRQDLQVTWTGGTTSTEIIVFSQPTGWDGVVAKDKVYGSNKEYTFQNLDDGTYFVGARSWYRDATGAWTTTLLSPRVEHVVRSSSTILFVPEYADGPNEGSNDPILGARRRAAFEYALDIWSGVLASSYSGETINVQITMDPISNRNGKTILGKAESAQYYIDETLLFPSALVNHMERVDRNSEQPEILAIFNSNLDAATNLTNVSWHYDVNSVPDAHGY